ncbi:MAG: precorrin-8X methylmutase, partial [Oscillospiraceae bacterium]|nr:precorrin-8X methylmutase [Oscillospiraceae bacterium]
DTNMALSGINKKALEKLGAQAVCFMADTDIAEKASADGTTRAAASIDKAVQITGRPLIFVSGNAPTFLIRLYEHIQAGFTPALVIAMPVGFVNVEHSKELIASSGVPFIAAMGRKGGSNIAAAAVNALMYRLVR